MPTPAPHGHGTTRLAPHRRFWPRRVPFDLPAAQTTLWDNLDISARRYPDKPAFVFFGRALGFAQLRAQAQRLAGWLHSKAGVREGDRVVLALQNSPQYVIACYALLRLRAAGQIRSAFVVDFDLHTGDGTKDVLRGWPEAQVVNTYGDNAAELIQNLAERLKQAPQVDILAVSAGFDAYIHDLGGKLATDDYFTIGRLLQGYAIRLGHQRRFAVLEGGYYLPDLGKNALAFCRGFE